nr:hypothetical protein [uncultured Psychroserpens sp.]
MKKVLIVLVLILSTINLQAQIGIGNTNPDASSILDITSSDKGVLVPRISLANVSNLTTPINSPATGLLIWNTNASAIGGNGIGFYFFNGAQWTPLTQVVMEDHDFYEEGTSTAPNNINDDIYTFGNVAIGKNNAVFNLDIAESANTRTINLDNNTTSGVISGIFNTISGTMTTLEQQRGVYNLLTGTGNNPKYGVFNDISGAGTQNRFGTYNSLTTDSDSNDYGVYNYFTSSGITNLRARYGTNNLFNNSGLTVNIGTNTNIIGSGSGAQYGNVNTIRNSGNGAHFGVQNNMEGIGSGTHYGVHNQFLGIGTGLIIGYSNTINVSGNGNHYGVNNSISGTGDGVHYGTNISMHGTGIGYKYGVNTFISPTAGGTHFGIRSTVKKAGSFSGFFVGDVAIGTEGFGGSTPDHYILPSSRGSNNQIMQTDASGNVTWQDPSALGVDDHDFYEEGTTTAPSSINDDIFTQGNLAIGKNTADYNLDIIENLDTRTINLENASTTGIISGVFNNVSGTMTTADAQRGVYNLVAGSGNNPKYGVYNNITGAGTDNRYGSYNTVTTNSESIDYGTYNNITSSSLGWRFKYGTYNSINNGGESENYGVYNILNGSSTRHQYGVRNTIVNTAGTVQFGIRNTLSGSNGVHYAVYNDFQDDSNSNQIGITNFITNNGSGQKTGFDNQVGGNGNDWHTGIINNVYGNGSDRKIGIVNSIGGTGAGTKFGSQTTIHSTSGGDHFGVYSEALKATGNTFAGFFVGNVAIGTEDFNLTTPNHYTLPASRGTNNQIMQTDGAGQVNWVDLPSPSFWSKTGTNLDVATVADDINFSSDQTSITFPATSGTPSSMIYMFNGGFSNSNRMVFSHSTTYNDWGLQYRDSDDAFRFLGGGADRVTINLGTGNPLVVNGNAQATSFISSTTTYPDYVFETYFDGESKLNETYTFKPLSEVEAFIKNNGHLPGVIPYKDVKANNMNISLTKTTVTNLEKIEELFLYTIELEKENNRLKENQKALEARLKKIETLVLQKD